MGSRGQIRLKNIWKMLRKCAEGFERAEKTHHHEVRFGDRAYGLPKGKHGSKNLAEIEIGHVRHLIRVLEIDEDCARTHLPQLGKKKS